MVVAVLAALIVHLYATSQYSPEFDLLRFPSQIGTRCSPVVVMFGLTFQPSRLHLGGW